MSQIEMMRNANDVMDQLIILMGDGVRVSTAMKGKKAAKVVIDLLADFLSLEILFYPDGIYANAVCIGLEPEQYLHYHNSDVRRNHVAHWAAGFCGGVRAYQQQMEFSLQNHGLILDEVHQAVKDRRKKK